MERDLTEQMEQAAEALEFEKAAALRDRSGLPLFVLCPDDSAAENMAADLQSMLGEDVRSPTKKGKFQHTSAFVPKGPAGHTQPKLLSRLQKGRSDCQGSPFPKRPLSWELGQRQGGVPRGLSVGPFQKSGV